MLYSMCAMCCSTFKTDSILLTGNAGKFPSSESHHTWACHKLTNHFNPGCHYVPTNFLLTCRWRNRGGQVATLTARRFSQILAGATGSHNRSLAELRQIQQLADFSWNRLLTSIPATFGMLSTRFFPAGCQIKSEWRERGNESETVGLSVSVGGVGFA